MKILKAISSSIKELAMGRKRTEMSNLLDALDETIQEHIWKLFAYSWDRPQDVTGWLKSLNKHLVKLRRYNSAKEGGLNYDRGQLEDRITETMFGTIGDIEVLKGTWSDMGYPEVRVRDIDHAKLKTLSNRYVDCILQTRGKFYVETEELLN